MDIEKIASSLKGYETEAMLSESEQDIFYFEGKACKNPQNKKHASLTIRVTKNKKSGVCTTTDLNNWKKCLRKARKICDLSKKGEFFGLPKKSKYPKVGLGQKKIEQMPLQDLKSMAKSFVDNSKAKVVDASFYRIKGKNSFANSNNIFYENTENLLSCSISVKQKDAVAYETHCSRKIKDFGWVSKKASDLCLKSIGKKTGKTGVYDLFLGYFGVSELMQILAKSFYANNIQQGNSKLKGMKQKQMFSEKISISDNAKLDYGIFSGIADDEGVPAKNKVLVDKGVVKEFLYDYTTAKKDGRKSTGNFGDLSSRPSISQTNFIVKPGKKTTKEILSDFNGIYVNSLVGSHTANPVSGDFSLNTENAFLIEKGEWKPLKHVMVAGNLFELLRRVRQIVKEQRQESSVMCSPMVFSDVQIIV